MTIVNPSRRPRSIYGLRRVAERRFFLGMDDDTESDDDPDDDGSDEYVTDDEAMDAADDSDESSDDDDSDDESDDGDDTEQAREAHLVALRRQDRELTAALANPTLYDSERHELLAQLNVVRQSMAQREREAADLDWAAMVVQEVAGPRVTHSRHTAASDWVAEMPAYEDMGPAYFELEAAQWMRQVGASVLAADPEEWAVQAHGQAVRVAGAIPGGQSAFIAAVSRMAAPSTSRTAGRVKTAGERKTIVLPYSEVCMFMGVAGKAMEAELISDYAVQLLDEAGNPFSYPITRGEAGWDHQVDIGASEEYRKNKQGGKIASNEEEPDEEQSGEAVGDADMIGVEDVPPFPTGAPVADPENAAAFAAEQAGEIGVIGPNGTVSRRVVAGDTDLENFLVHRQAHPATGFQIYDTYQVNEGRYVQHFNGPMVERPRLVVYDSVGGIGQVVDTIYLNGDEDLGATIRPLLGVTANRRQADWRSGQPPCGNCNHALSSHMDDDRNVSCKTCGCSSYSKGSSNGGSIFMDAGRKTAGVGNYNSDNWIDWGYEASYEDGELVVEVALLDEDGDVINGNVIVTSVDVSISDHGNTNVSPEVEASLADLAIEMASAEFGDDFYLQGPGLQGKSASRKTAGGRFEWLWPGTRKPDSMVCHPFTSVGGGDTSEERIAQGSRSIVRFNINTGHGIANWKGSNSKHFMDLHPMMGAVEVDMPPEFLALALGNEYRSGDSIGGGVYMAGKTANNLDQGWIQTPSANWPGEDALTCPDCGSQNITMSGSSLKDYGLGRGFQTVECGDCGRKTSEHVPYKASRRKTAGLVEWTAENDEYRSGDSIGGGVYMAGKTANNFDQGWILTPSARRPGEDALTCPDCGGQDITMSGSSLREWGLGRGYQTVECGGCGRKTSEHVPYKASRRKTAGLMEEWQSGYLSVDDAAIERLIAAGYASPAARGMDPEEVLYQISEVNGGEVDDEIIGIIRAGSRRQAADIMEGWEADTDTEMPVPEDYEPFTEVDFDEESGPSPIEVSAARNERMIDALFTI